MTRRRRQLLLWAASLALWYTLFGFFVAPRILKAVALWQLPKQIGRPVALQKIKLNPFTISIAVRGFGVTEPDGAPFVGWDELDVNFDPTGLFSRQLVLSQVVLRNAFGRVQVNKDGRFNFSDILERFPARPTPPEQKSGKPMVVRIGQFRITGSHLVYDDFTRAQPFTTTVGPIDVTLRDFSTDPNNQNPYGFTAVTESGEKFSWRGFFYLGPVRSTGQFAIEGISLKKYAPYYDELVNLTTRDGFVDVNADYRVTFTDKLELGQLSNLTVTVRSLKIAGRGATNDVIEIPRISLTGATADAIAQSVEVPSLTIADARITAVLLTNHSVNLLALLSTNSAAPAASQSVVARWESLRLAGIRAQAKPLTFAVASITLTNAGLDYADAAPPASLSLSRVHATVTGLSTDPNAQADLRLTGRVGNLGSLEASGRVNPLNMDAATEFAAALHAMDLVPLGPYSGKYAGYELRRGKLSVAVKYSIAQRRLNASNDILVDQFSFGEATGSPDAVRLPVKLAVAILKDRNGQIKLDVPVEGRIDDPQFRYWGAVWHVLGGLFTKIFTAPFAMLGSMFGGGEELGWQEFAPGSSELLPDQVKKLDVLIRAMTERPGLLLEIEGNVDKLKDREPIQRRKLHELVAARAGSTNDYVAGLRVLYAEALPAIEARLPAPPPPPRITSNIGNLTSARPTGSRRRPQKVAAELSPEEMERNYFLILDVSDDDYRRLATERAERVRSYLVETGRVDAERVWLADLSKRPPPTAGARAVFSLQ